MNNDNDISETVYDGILLSLREERNKKLKDCDYLLHPDYPISSDTVKQNWITYRQALRDLPATVSLQFDDNGDLIDITWPTPPS